MYSLWYRAQQFSQRYRTELTSYELEVHPSSQETSSAELTSLPSSPERCSSELTSNKLSSTTELTSTKLSSTHDTELTSNELPELTEHELPSLNNELRHDMSIHEGRLKEIANIGGPFGLFSVRTRGAAQRDRQYRRSL